MNIGVIGVALAADGASAVRVEQQHHAQRQCRVHKDKKCNDSLSHVLL